MKVIGKEIFLKILNVEDVSETYVKWMEDEEITQFLESRWQSFTLNDLKNYVDSINKSTTKFLFGIFLKATSEHIGNIKIGEINQIHRYADIGLIIGNKTMWGKGLGSEAIELITTYAFKELNLNTLFAGMYANNVGSFKAFIKAGYEEVGRFKKRLYYKGYYVDEILVEKQNTKEI